MEKKNKMDLTIQDIQRRGQKNEEFVLLNVENDCNLENYILSDTTYYSKTNKISNKLRHIFWFPDTAVKKGDTVIVYSGKKESIIERAKAEDLISKLLGFDSKTHKFYWELNEGIWNDDKDKAIIFHISEYRTFLSKD